MITSPASTINEHKIKPAKCAERWVYAMTALQRRLDRFHLHHRIASSELRQQHVSRSVSIAVSQAIEARPSQPALAIQKH